ncbi:TonB-dependent receptor domain-containing protein [Chitinophaga sp. GCM10012297]|uniref:TonB-dependent receptor n=1 Tax=Chitinophaga chungangae TaxID=2821488 RepID=A0ABS3Y9V9_9BACT|nr:TonB-dependent receptor [Chitinophaga chungangae]MBO9151460.1 TonB-dependent receptor [Chitinophaga chungangae]
MKSNFMLLILSVLLISNSYNGQAQTTPDLTDEKGKVTGTVLKTGNKPVEFATVTLLKVKDSSLVKGAIADMEGKYVFEGIAEGQYLVAAANMGYKKNFSKPLKVNGSPVKVPAIVLSEETRNLKEINVTGKRPFIEQKADKMVVNVENSIVAAGGTALEVLQQSPGIQVDKDDNISMRGKNGVIIMIDGKPTNMSPQDVALLLKNMPSSNIDQIELIANPSAKYDAAGNAGIINIKLKKNSNFGTNGSVNATYGQGKLPRGNAGLNLNHRNQHLNVYGSYNYSYNRQFEALDIYRDNIEKSGRIVFDQHSFLDKESQYHGAKAGIDWFLDKNHTLGVMVNVAGNRWKGDGNSETWIGNGQRIDSSLKTITDNRQNMNRQSYNLNYKGKLDTTGKEINIDLDYSRNAEDQHALLYSGYMDAHGKIYFRGDTTRSLQPSIINIKTAKIDYTHPLKNDAKFEAGVKISFVESDNNSRFDSLRYGSWEYDYNRSNYFVYKENVNAAYLNFSKQFKKIGVQAGLRAEQTNVEGNSVTLKQVNDTSYLNFFPSIFLSYNASKDHQWGISYSRRLQRPSYDDLNPFEFYLDRYTKAGGNPNLRPQYSSNFDLTHTFKSFLTTAIGYSHTTDMLSRILEPGVDSETGDTTIVVYRYMNVAKKDNVNLNISAPVPVTKWWKTFTTFSVFYNAFETTVNGELIKRSSGGFFGNTQHTFTLGKGYTAEASFWYNSSQISQEGLFRMNPMYAFNVGFQKTVLDKKGTIRLNVNDVFNTQRFGGTYSVTNRDIKLANRWDSRQVRVSFTYRFGNSNVKEARNRKTGLEDEQSRVK